MINVKMTEEEYALFKKLKIQRDKEQQILLMNKARHKDLITILEHRVLQYINPDDKNLLKTSCQYVRGTIKLRAGISRINATQGITEEEYNALIKALDNVLPNKNSNKTTQRVSKKNKSDKDTRDITCPHKDRCKTYQYGCDGISYVFCDKPKDKVDDIENLIRKR